MKLFYTIFAPAIVVIAIGVLMMVAAGCTTDKTEIINRTNAIYKNIKLIVTDESVRPMITDEQMEMLATAERVYLEAVQQIEAEDVGSSGWKISIDKIVGCADMFLSVIDALNISGPYEPVVTAAKLSVKILRANI